MNSFHSVIGDSDADVARRLKEKHERIDYEQGRLKLADMLGGDLDLSELPLDKPLPEALLPEVTSINRRRGRVEIRIETAGVTVEQLGYPLRTGRGEDQASMMPLADTRDHLWIVVGRGIGMLLPRQ